MTNYERETTINFNEAEDTATVDTCNTRMLNQLNKFSASNPLCTLVRTDQYGGMYKIPKTWIKVRPPRELSDEERSKLSERAKSNFHGNLKEVKSK
jgi:hypothetical protein